MMPARRFVFRLALALGEPNPDRMLAQMPLRIFREWHAYYQYDPFGGERMDVLIANFMAWVGNLRAGKNRYKAKNFVPQWGPKDEPTPDQMFQKVVMANRMLGGKFVDKRKKRGESD